jgi:threonine dehydrogenase-like Zn-dependent dehydrogenase
MTLPASMNALILKGHGFAPTREGAAIETLEPYLEYGSLPVPKPGPGQVLIRVRMASVNPSDIHFIKGEYGQPRIKGAAAGFEGVGDVVAGSGLYAAYLKGKRVAFVGGVNGSGAWAEYIVVQAAMCVVVKPAMRDEDAAGHVVNPVTAWTMFDIVKASGSKELRFHRCLLAARQVDGRAGAGQRLRDDRRHPKGKSGGPPQGARRKARAAPV